MKKLKIHLRVLIIFFVILSTIGILVVRGNEYCTIQGNYETVEFDDYILNVKGYEIRNGHLEIIEDDPQLIFDFGKYQADGVYAFSLELSEEIDLSKVQVFFGREKFEFTEHDSKILEGGKSDVVEIISVKPFNYLRIDINDDITIKNIGISDSLKVTKEENNIYYVVAVLGSLLISIILSYFKKIDSFILYLENQVILIFKSVTKKKLNSFLIAMLVPLEMVISYAVEKIISYNSAYLNRQRMVIIFAVMLIASFTYIFRKYILSKLHIYFFLVVMILGMSHVIIAPPIAGISWDDEIHYGRTAYLSWFSNGMISATDEEMIRNYNNTITDRKEYTAYGRTVRVSELCSLEDKFGDVSVLVDVEDYSVNLQYIAYIPTAVALSCGRGMGLSYTHVYMFGKLINVFCYALIISLAIRIMRGKGKMIIALLGLLPTGIFLASSYSYDWWVISFCILGYAYFISKLKKKEVFTNAQFIGLMFIMLIALLPKAIYFPIILPMMLLKKDKYKNSKLCRTLVIITMLLLVATFIFPILFATATGDSRGGSDVDSMKQISFILNNPIEYTEILLGFLSRYLSLDTAKGYTTMMGYYGTARHFVVCLVIIAIAAVIDNGNGKGIKNKNYTFIKAATVFCCFGAIVLASTALYVSFTAVGYHTILGCQPRYIMPLLFPTIYCLSDFEITVQDKTKNTFIAMAVCVMAFIFLKGIFTLCGKYY